MSFAPYGHGAPKLGPSLPLTKPKKLWGLSNNYLQKQFLDLGAKTPNNYSITMIIQGTIRNAVTNAAMAASIGIDL